MKVDIGMFHEELKEIAAFQITNAVSILYTMACTALQKVDEKLFIQDLNTFVASVLNEVRENITYTMKDGEGTFLLTGDIKELVQRSLNEAEMLKMEKIAAQKYIAENEV